MGLIGLAGGMFSKYGNIDATYNHITCGGCVFVNTVYRDGQISGHVYQLLHHEMSSLLMHAGLVDMDEWRSLTPIESYSGDMLVTSNARPMTAREARAGFLTSYGGTNPENDFNVYAEMTFGQPELVLRQASQFPAAKEKANFVRELYQRLGFRLPQ